MLYTKGRHIDQSCGLVQYRWKDLCAAMPSGGNTSPCFDYIRIGFSSVQSRFIGGGCDKASTFQPCFVAEFIHGGL